MLFCFFKQMAADTINTMKKVELELVMSCNFVMAFTRNQNSKALH